MSDDVLVALIEQAVPVATFVLVLVAVVLLWASISDLVGRATKIGIGGAFEVSAEPLKSAPSRPPVSDRDVRAVERRVERNRERLARMRLLWVDDLPENNRVERSYLRDLGVAVTVAVSSDEALRLLDRVDPTVVVTDIARPESATAGLQLAATLATARPDLPVIGYVGTLRPGTPPGFLRLTNRPDELIHLLLDASERSS